SGIVGGRAHIGGTTVSPRGDATIASDGISYNGYYIDRLQGDIVYDNGLVRTIISVRKVSFCSINYNTANAYLATFNSAYNICNLIIFS
ncbi:hypothetical protein Q604_UNBC10039G0001, partial [human gut metagenome]